MDAQTNASGIEAKRGEEIFEHCVIVANITEGIILGLDSMKKKNGIKLDLEAGIKYVKDRGFHYGTRRTPK